MLEDGGSHICTSDLRLRSERSNGYSCCAVQKSRCSRKHKMKKEQLLPILQWHPGKTGCLLLGFIVLERSHFTFVILIRQRHLPSGLQKSVIPESTPNCSSCRALLCEVEGPNDIACVGRACERESSEISEQFQVSGTVL